MDQIAELLTRIRNATSVRKYSVKTAYSKMKEAILMILKSEGFIADFQVVEDESKKVIEIEISPQNAPIHLKKISKSGQRVYVKNNKIPKPLRGLGTTIVSTSSGIVTGREAAKKGLGGELICEIW